MENPIKLELDKIIHKKAKNYDDLVYFLKYFHQIYDPGDENNFRQLFSTINLQNINKLAFARANPNQFILSQNEGNLKSGMILLRGTAKLMI